MTPLRAHGCGVWQRQVARSVEVVETLAYNAVATELALGCHLQTLRPVVEAVMAYSLAGTADVKGILPEYQAALTPEALSSRQGQRACCGRREREHA